ncbi:hypothetical protein P7H11_18350, partial [Paenibacillus larvae]
MFHWFGYRLYLFSFIRKTEIYGAGAGIGLSLRCRLTAPAFLIIVEKGKLLDRFSYLHVRLMQLISGVYGPRQQAIRTKYYAVEMLSLSFIVLAGFILLGLVSGEGPVLVIFG